MFSQPSATRFTIRDVLAAPDQALLSRTLEVSKASRTALLSQEGSTIETAVEIVRGVVPEPHSLRTHSETFRLGNHPSRHRKDRDDAALLTQEGNSAALTVILILCGEDQSRFHFTPNQFLTGFGRVCYFSTRSVIKLTNMPQNPNSVSAGASARSWTSSIVWAAQPQRSDRRIDRRSSFLHRAHPAPGS